MVMRRVARGVARAARDGALAALRHQGQVYVRMPFSAPRTCNICGYAGTFDPFGLYFVRPDAICRGCGSLERQRLLARYLEMAGWSPEGKAILHFAAEPAITRLLAPRAARYVRADLFDPGADVAWDIERIDCGEAEFDAVVCSHVLEHVDTERALGEIRRVLRPGGRAILMIPINEGLDRTYLDPSVTGEAGRHLHFQQPDHVRIIGRDFRDQVRGAGLRLEEFAAGGAEAARFGLVAGERVFVAHRDAAVTDGPLATAASGG